jgi:cell division protein FtsB
MKIIRSTWFKYLLVLLIFGIWITFFDDYKLSKQFELNAKLDSLQTKLQETEAEVAKWKLKNAQINDSIETIEATGRNNYRIKRDNEDVYIFVKEDEDGKLVSFE